MYASMAGIDVRGHLPDYHRDHRRNPAPHSSGSEGGARTPSPGVVTPPPSPGGKGSLLETPTRKNKRKLSEPRKRGGSDFSIKRLCPDSPGGSAMSESACSDDGADNNDNNSRAEEARHRLSNDQDSSSSRGPSEREDTPGPSTGASIPHGMPHPFFPAMPAFLPGFYLDGRAAGYPGTGGEEIPLGRAAFPHPPFPGIPLGLPPPGLSLPPDRRDMSHGESSRQSTSSVLQPQDLSSRAESPENLSGESTNGGSGGRKPRKNYKNMTRERRVEANARERTRVHTISAAFDALRRAVPSYSYNQKLSKLAILRIACSYIMALARLADIDCSSEPSVPLTFADCVDLCTRTIQTEGRARRRH